MHNGKDLKNTTWYRFPENTYLELKKEELITILWLFRLRIIGPCIYSFFVNISGMFCDVWC